MVGKFLYSVGIPKFSRYLQYVPESTLNVISYLLIEHREHILRNISEINQSFFRSYEK